MNWKLKSKIQNSISFLPRSTSDSIDYFMQKQFGELRKFNPIATIITSVGICKHILESGGSLSNKVFFEIGTGRAPIAPLVFWLIGAKKTITIDINSYVKKY